MFIMTAKQMDKTLSRLESDPDCINQFNFQMKMHRDAIKFFTDNKNIIPTEKNYEDATRHIINNFGICVNRDDIETILSLFPSARIKLAVYDGCEDTEVRDLISEAICVYFCGCKIPTYGDNVDIERFYKHLLSQAKIMGFKLHND